MTSIGRTRAPIALQLVALLVASLIAGQIMIFAVVVLMPPPPRPVYRMEEVVRALKGGSLKPSYGHELTRDVQNDPPVEPEPRRERRPPGEGGRMRSTEWSRRQMANLLGVPEADVRLTQHAPNPNLLMRAPFGERLPVRFQHLRDRAPDAGDARPVGMGAAGAGPIGPGPMPGGPPPDGGPGFMMRGDGPGPGLGPDSGPAPRGVGPTQDVAGPGGRAMSFNAGGLPLFGEFTAALKQSDGRWLVVKPKAESFPNDWQRRFLLWLGGCLVLTAPLGYLFARRITAPIGRFAHAAEALGRDPSGPLMALSGPAEIGMAAQAFNDMQARLKRYIEDRTAMVGAISHDLRTPLARIRFKLEAAPEPVRQAVIADVEQMEQMISSVLAFIRDASAGRPRERLDLLSLVECLVDDAAQTGKEVVLADGAPATVEADALGLQRLFDNLVDNAVKYGRRAEVKLTAADGDAVVEIADRGPGIAEADLERVFRPFYRADEARTLDGRGVGLGLAVARSIARAHGGDVTLENTEPGLTARVRLPLSAS